jgi:hypothetical protein
MTDTRKKSNRGDYDLEQEFNFGRLDYCINPQNNYGEPVKTYLPGNGLLGPRVSRVNLANNSCDIESMLRGTGSCNMVQPQAPIVPDIRHLQSLNLFETRANPLPEPLVVKRGERPAWELRELVVPLRSHTTL